MAASDDDIIPQVCPWLGDEERDAVAAVVAGGWISEGPASAEFSRQLNAVIGAPFGVLAPNCTLAMAMGLMALGVGPGDEVLVPDTTFIGSATAVMMVGATPVFVEVDDELFHIDLAHAETLVTERTRAVLAVHLYGTMCDMTAVMAFAAGHGLRVIEDAAQALGVTQGGRHAGLFGDVGCFSFFADKTITTGEGGYAVCRDPAIHQRLLYLRNQGRLGRGAFVHPQIGYNFRITDMQAAMGLAQLGKLDRIVAAKRAHHAAYSEALATLPQVRVLGSAPDTTFVPFRCVLMAERAHDLMAYLEARNIQSRTVFAPLHSQPCFVDAPGVTAGDDGPFPNACRAYDEGVCLPIFPTLSAGQIARITDAIAAFYG